MFVLFLRVYSSCREHQYFHFDAVVESDKILCLFEWIKSIFLLSSVPFPLLYLLHMSSIVLIWFSLLIIAICMLSYVIMSTHVVI